MFDSIEGELTIDGATRIVLRLPVGEGALSYELRTPVGTGTRLPRRGAIVCCWVATCSVDDLPRLFGFASPEERELFGLVRKVSGVGPSLALALLSSARPEELLRAIGHGEAKTLQQTKGIGKKTAERICLELADRARQLAQTLGLDGTAAGPAPALDAIEQDAIAALVTLGYPEHEAERKVRALRAKDPDADIEALIKGVLSA